jgi:hypothetical protein
MGGPRRFLWRVVSLMRWSTEYATLRRPNRFAPRLINAVLVKALSCRDPAHLVGSKKAACEEAWRRSTTRC